MKFLFHIHTYHSYDCLIKPKSIIEYAIKNNIDIVAITDHDTLKGSIDAKEYVTSNKLPVTIIIAAEYKTDCGDIIGLFLKNEIKEKNAEKLIDEIHLQGGIAVLPHPYKSHNLNSTIIQKIDVIETFNARCNDIENEKALQLALKHNKPILYGIDAHIKRELCLGYNMLSISNLEEAIMSKKEIFGIHTTKLNIVISQFIKAFKTKDFILFCKMSKSLISILFISKIRGYYKKNK